MASGLPLQSCSASAGRRLRGWQRHCRTGSVLCCRVPFRCRESAVWMPTDHLRVLCQALAPVIPVGLRVLDRLAEQRLVIGGRVRGGRLAPAALGLLRVARQLAMRLTLALLPLRALLGGRLASLLRSWHPKRDNRCTLEGSRGLWLQDRAQRPQVWSFSPRFRTRCRGSAARLCLWQGVAPQLHATQLPPDFEQVLSA